MVQGHRRQYRQGRRELSRIRGIAVAAFNRGGRQSPASDRHAEAGQPSDQKAVAASSDIAFTPRSRPCRSAAARARTMPSMEAEGGCATTYRPDPRRLPRRRRGRSTWPRRARTASPTSSIAAGRTGFLRVIDEHDAGASPTSRATGSTSPPATSPRIRRPIIFVMDYAHRRRVKLWGSARVVEDDPALIARLCPRATRRATSR